MVATVPISQPVLRIGNLQMNIWRKDARSLSTKDSQDIMFV